MTAPTPSDVFLKLDGFYRATTAQSGPHGSRIVHALNPFPTKPGTEHDRAQQVTLATMTRARETAKSHKPDLQIDFAKVIVEDTVDTPGIDFETTHRLDRTITDLHSFNIPRPLPLAYDVLTALPLAQDDILVFTNVDIALMPDFYLFLDQIFARDVDAAVINRRSISDAYTGVDDLVIMGMEVGNPHTGFDCFAMRGSVRDKLVPYTGCVGIAGVMLPLVHMLLAKAERPVVLLDAHATFHLGNDRQWRSEKFADYSDHNIREIDRVFDVLTADSDTRERLIQRLSGAHAPWVFPRRLKTQAGVGKPAGLPHRIARKIRSFLR